MPKSELYPIMECNDKLTPQFILRYKLYIKSDY